MCVLLAEKCYAEEQNSSEAFSLATGIPIRELNSLEVKLMVLMDYRLVVRERDFGLLLEGDMAALFNERKNYN